MSGVTMLIKILEHLGMKDPVIIRQISNINTMYIQEMARALTPDYKILLIQGMMVNFWYD